MSDISDDERELIARRASEMLSIVTKVDNSESTHSLSGNKTLYVIFGLIFIIVMIRIVLTKTTYDAPIPVALVWFLMLIPWVLLSLYIFDKYSLHRSVDVSIPGFGKIEMPGGQFVISTVALLLVLAIGKVDYDNQKQALTDAVTQRLKEDAEARWNSLENTQNDINGLLSKRISQNLALKFDEAQWPNDQRCRVHGVLVISQANHLYQCDQLQSYNVSDVANYPVEGGVFRLQSNNCALKTDLSALIDLIAQSGDDKEIGLLQDKYSQMRDQGLYHAIMVLTKNNTTPMGTQDRNAASVSTQKQVTPKEPYLIPLFSIDNKSLEDRTVSIYMERLGHISDVCNLGV